MVKTRYQLDFENEMVFTRDTEISLDIRAPRNSGEEGGERGQSKLKVPSPVQISMCGVGVGGKLGNQTSKYKVLSKFQFSGGGGKLR